MLNNYFNSSVINFIENFAVIAGKSPILGFLQDFSEWLRWHLTLEI